MISEAIQDAFDAWAKELLRDLEAAIAKKKLVNSGSLRESLRIRIEKVGEVLQVSVGFKQYGRILDMKKRDSDPNKIDRLGHLVPKRDRNRRWYNTTVWRAMPKMREQVAESIFAAATAEIGALSDNP